MTITIHTGCAGDTDTINVDWFDHDNVRHQAVIELVMLNRDKPRTLQIRVDGKAVAEYVPSQCAPGGLHSAVLGMAQPTAATDRELEDVAKAAKALFLNARAPAGGQSSLDVRQADFEALRWALVAARAIS